MIIQTVGLFTLSEQVEKCSDDLIVELIGDVIEDGDVKLYPTPIAFDMCDVVVINKSQHEGYTCLRTIAGDYCVKIEYEKAVRLWKLCH